MRYRSDWFVWAEALWTTVGGKNFPPFLFFTNLLLVTVFLCYNYISIEMGDMPNKQLKMLLGWAAIHQEELQENWYLARQKQELFTIEPLR